MLVESSTVSTMFGGAEGEKPIGSSASFVICASAGSSGASAICSVSRCAMARFQSCGRVLFMFDLEGQRSIACEKATEFPGPSTRTVIR